MNLPEHYRLIIIGAGPAGLFLAASLDQSVKPLILEKKLNPGSKLLISGSGRCNIAPSRSVEELFSHYPSGKNFMKKSLHSFSNTDLIKWFERRGMSFVTDANGKLFPERGGSAMILKILVEAAEKNGARILTGTSAEAAEKTAGGYRLRSGNNIFESDYLAIAAGGSSYPHTGSEGDSYTLASLLGLRVRKPRPALVPVYTEEYGFSDLSGISVRDSEIVLRRNKKNILKHRGDLLFTHRTLSGPGILNISGRMEPGDLIRFSMVRSELIPETESLILRAQGGMSLTRALTPLDIPARLLKKLIQISGISEDSPAGALSRQQKTLLTENIIGFSSTVKSTGSFKEAMVTSGGVELNQIRSSTMEAKNSAGLFVIGEALDIDGETGGYNLQACFSTARAAAEYIGRGQGED